MILFLISHTYLIMCVTFILIYIQSDDKKWYNIQSNDKKWRRKFADSQLVLVAMEEE